MIDAIVTSAIMVLCAVMTVVLLRLIRAASAVAALDKSIASLQAKIDALNAAHALPVAHSGPVRKNRTVVLSDEREAEFIRKHEADNGR